MNIICGWNVANSILIKSFKDKVYITPLKLNCLVYLLYSEYLYSTQETLFNETFMKADKGPILFSLYEKFASYKYDVIKRYATDAKSKITYVQNEKFNECLNYIWEKYKNKSENDILLYLENGDRYNKKKTGCVIDKCDILNDIIEIKEKELEQARSYVRKLTPPNNKR